MNFHILEECRRCLQCRKPSCTEGCPVGTEIPKMIRLLLDGNINESGEMLFRNNPLSAICALVCQHEKVCEGHCILAKKQSPIQIGTARLPSRSFTVLNGLLSGTASTQRTGRNDCFA